jgi:hypothetical protein
MSHTSISPLKFWIYTPLDLVAIAYGLAAAGVIEDFHCDSENVYDWCIAAPAGRADIELNLSRKHDDGATDPEEPLSFLVISRNDTCPPEGLVRELAARVNAALQTMVYIGTIEYLGEDDYCYTATKKLNPTGS